MHSNKLSICLAILQHAWGWTADNQQQLTRAIGDDDRRINQLFSQLTFRPDPDHIEELRLDVEGEVRRNQWTMDAAKIKRMVIERIDSDRRP